MFRLAEEWGGASDHKTMQLAGWIKNSCNWPKYWGLTEAYAGPGTHRLTEDGYAFLGGTLRIPRIVWKFDNEVIDVSPEKVSVHDILGEDYKTHAEIVAWIHANQRTAGAQVLRRNRARRRRVTRRPREVPLPSHLAASDREIARHVKKPRGRAQSKAAPPRPSRPPLTEEQREAKREEALRREEERIRATTDR